MAADSQSVAALYYIAGKQDGSQGHQPDADAQLHNDARQLADRVANVQACGLH
jgi:hypothetical protein